MTELPGLRAAGAAGAAGVILLSLSAHGTSSATAALLRPAGEILLFHAAALLGLALYERGLWTRRCRFAGLPLFAGALVGLALGGPKALGLLAPLGGSLLILGWILLLVRG